MKKKSLQLVFALIAALFIGTICSAMSKNPVLRGTRWTAVQEMFVADAGMMTITYTLEFLTDKTVTVREESYLPAHPAMYMNPDGSVDQIPARSSEYTKTGTYTYRDGLLTITSEEGTTWRYYHQKDGTFTRKESWGDILVFSRSEAKPEQRP